MKILAINKISSNLKIMRFKMPNAAYSNRCGALKITHMNRMITLIFFGLILMSCGQNKTNEKAKLVDQQVSNNEIQLDTSMVAILPFDTTQYWIFKNAKQTDLSISNLVTIENILFDCIAEYNFKQEQQFNEISSENPEYNLDINHFIIDIEKYNRQYMPVINDKGEKEVWINCFCNSWEKDWRKERIIVKDGGNCYFNLKINLGTKKYYDFMVNGNA